MGKKWYDDLPDDYFEQTIDKVYEAAFGRIREGLDRGLGFDEACAELDVQDEELRKQIAQDMLKVLIAEEHFAKHVPLDRLAKQLKVSAERLEATKSNMLDEVLKGSFKISGQSPDFGTP